MALTEDLSTTLIGTQTMAQELRMDTIGIQVPTEENH